MKNICHSMPLVNTIYQISKTYNKHYCYPSQKRLQKLLSEIYGIDRSISTINRWLRLIEDAGLLKRVRRITLDSNGEYNFRSTMYFLKLKGLKKLNQLGYDVWEALKSYYDKKSIFNQEEKKLVASDGRWGEIRGLLKGIGKKKKQKPDI